MLRVSGLKKTFGEHLLFRAVSIAISPGERVALVGPNGSGKSTLLKILCGDIAADDGTIRWAPNARLAYLPQQVNAPNALSVRGFCDNTGLSLRMAKLQEQLECDPNNSVLVEEYGQIIDKFTNMHGWSQQARLEGLLTRLKMSEINIDQLVSTLSGGQKTRLALARVLMSDATVLLLDEPTNNLDLESLEWLESELLRTSSTCLIVSHDRRFLDRITTRTLELDNLSRSLKNYSGNYTWYRARKSQELNRQWREFKEQEQRVRQLKVDIRTTKQQALSTELRTVNDYERSRAKKVAAKAKARETRLMRMISDENKIEKPRQNDRMRMELKSVSTGNGRLIAAERVNFSFDDHMILQSINLDLRDDQRVIVTGSNGSGKTTLLRLLAGELSPSSGTVTRRHNLVVGFLPQEQQVPTSDITLLDYFLDRLYRHPNRDSSIDALKTESVARTFLHRFQFSGNDVFKKLSQLSRGEYTKLFIACSMAVNSELFILDEPTNHLDVDTMECLEEALLAYHGAVIVASHDRYFIDKIQPQIRWDIKEAQLTVTTDNA